MSLLLLFKPRYLDSGTLDLIEGGRYKKKHHEVSELAPLPSSDIPISKPLITLENLAGIELDLSSARDRKLLEHLAEEEQAILLMLMLDE